MASIIAKERFYWKLLKKLCVSARFRWALSAFYGIV